MPKLTVVSGRKVQLTFLMEKYFGESFSPPKEINLCLEFLNTLNKKEIMSGLGEIIKVHAIDGINSLNYLSVNF